jgi:hypothetical protein
MRGTPARLEAAVSTPDLAITAMAAVTLANTAAFLIGLRIVARQLRIAAPPKQQAAAETARSVT